MTPQGEREKGRKGEREKGRKGEREKSSVGSPLLPFSPSPLLRQRRRWLLFLSAALFLAGAMAVGWWWLHRPVPVDPPMPARISDPEILHVVRKARQAVLDKPDSAAAWGKLGMTLEAHLYELEADRCFAEAARLDPRDVRWPYLRFLCTPQADPQKGIAFLRQAAACTSVKEYQSAVNLRLAEALLEQHEYDEAERLFRGELYPQPGWQNPRAAYGLGLIAVARGNVQAAEEFLKTARQSSYGRKLALAQLAALAQARGDDAAAAAWTREAAPRPDDETTWPDPILELVASLQVGPNIRKQQARQFEEHHNYAAALQIYLREIEEKPTTEAFIGAGLNYARLNNYDKGLEYLHKAVVLDPENAQAHYTLALTQFDRAFRESKPSAISSQAQDWFRETVKHARRATELKPDHARAYLILGLSLRYLGEPTPAIVQLRNGVRCSPNDFDLQFYLGDTLLENGEVREAETYLENARKLNPNDKRPLEALQRLRRKKD